MRSYCVAHVSELLARFDPSSFGENGLMVPVAAAGDDGYADCVCARCLASAVTLPLSSCWWCVTNAERARQHQRELLLRPELPDADDERRPVALEGWAGRLARGVSAGLLTEHDARRALAREVGHARTA